MIDLRCDGTRKTGPGRGGPCQYLLCRYHPDLYGQLETKCPRCNKLRVWQFVPKEVRCG